MTRTTHLAVNHLALVANLFHACPYFHSLILQHFRDPPASRVVRRKLDALPGRRTNPDKILHSRARRVRQHPLPRFPAPPGTRRWATTPPPWHQIPAVVHGLVSTLGPSAVTATQCSKWAEYEPSFATAVQWSERALAIHGPPAFTIGSIANTMPSFNRGFSPLRST